MVVDVTGTAYGKARERAQREGHRAPGIFRFGTFLESSHPIKQDNRRSIAIALPPTCSTRPADCHGRLPGRSTLHADTAR